MRKTYDFNAFCEINKYKGVFNEFIRRFITVKSF